MQRLQALLYNYLTPPIFYNRKDFYNLLLPIFASMEKLQALTYNYLTPPIFYLNIFLLSQFAITNFSSMERLQALLPSNYCNK